MAVRAELKSIVVFITVVISGAIIGAKLGDGLYIAYVVPASDISASFPGAMDGTYTRRLAGADDMPFTQTAVNTRCAPGGDRSFPAIKTDLPGCYAKCSETPGCNHFAIGLSGGAKGWCNGCETGVSDYREHFVLFTMKDEGCFKQATSLSCGDGLVTSVDLDTLVDGGQPYEICISKEGCEEPTCSDLRNGGQASASIQFCAPSSSTSTSSSTATTTSTSTSTTWVFTPKDKDELEEALDMWHSNQEEAHQEYGDISTWSTSKITDMSQLFLNRLYFDDDISGWDVSQVTNMDSMFTNAFNFNQDISAWDVSKVTSMNAMFSSAHSFNQDISAWDVSKVRDMVGMFHDAGNFNQDISAWDVSEVTNMLAMFSLSGFTGNISTWNVSKVTNMASMFDHSAFNGDISAWDVSQVTAMEGMFYHSAFNGDISTWNVSQVTSMAYMFNFAKFFNQDISAWDVSKVTAMSQMFRGARSFNQDISSWNVGSVMDMHGMFEGAWAFALGGVDISTWSPTSLTSSPYRFLSDMSVPCRMGDWSSWGANVPDCYDSECVSEY